MTKKTIKAIQRQKGRKKITCLTAYTSSVAKSTYLSGIFICKSTRYTAPTKPWASQASTPEIWKCDDVISLC